MQKHSAASHGHRTSQGGCQAPSSDSNFPRLDLDRLLESLLVSVLIQAFKRGHQVERVTPPLIASSSVSGCRNQQFVLQNGLCDLTSYWLATLWERHGDRSTSHGTGLCSNKHLP
ncbi:hypothetical protein CSUI_006143 [Cystoisospora suis]|uniref:Uncharacterized protein n=1 Tax=Cystoisospora suis TaxID=483139 RepID=A0A2C6KVI3_9APIC|nr:hypothetical protein CSUI_006143 [Cystoisospora suis]